MCARDPTVVASALGGRWRDLQVARRDVIGQPHFVGAEEECVSVFVHRAGEDLQDDGGASAFADGLGGADVGREMDVGALAADEALFADRLDEARDRAVVEDLRRLSLLEAEIDLDGVALIGAQLRAFEGEALLVAGRDDFFEIGERDRFAARGQAAEDGIDIGITGIVERDAERGGVMPQGIREKLRDADGARSFHAVIVAVPRKGRPIA